MMNIPNECRIRDSERNMHERLKENNLLKCKMAEAFTDLRYQRPRIIVGEIETEGTTEYHLVAPKNNI